MQHACTQALRAWHIVLDYFYKISSSDVVFMSHWHRDHMYGLRAEWDQAPIYVSAGTYRLACEAYGETARAVQRMHVLTPHTWHTLTHAQVACLPAHHCYGSVMWLFRLPNGSTAVFTGDYKPTETTWTSPLWSVIQESPRTVLLLDTTFHDSRIRVPSLADSIAALEWTYQHKTPDQILAVQMHTSGVDQLIGAWCARYGHQWYLHVETLSSKKIRAIEWGLQEQAGALQGATQQHADVWCMGRGGRDWCAARIDDARRYVWVVPSAIWFQCHRNSLPPWSQVVNRPVPDVRGGLRIYFATHASFEENEALQRFLRPSYTTSTACSGVIRPPTCPTQSRRTNAPDRKAFQRMIRTKRLPQLHK